MEGEREAAFRGVAHEEALDVLLAAHAAVAAGGPPHFVNLVGETGLGKTRVVHELYRRLAAGDEYWPPAITASNQRKAIHPRAFHSNGEPTWMWFGLSCLRGSGGAPVSVLETQVPRQLEHHARTLLLRDARVKGRTTAARKAAWTIGSLLGTEFVKQLFELHGHYKALREIEDDLRQGSAAGTTRAVLGDDVNEDVVRAFLEIADLVDRDGMCLVLAVEDAHDADPTTIELLERLLAGRRRVLIVATSWPTALRRQAESGIGLGATIAHRVPDGAVAVTREVTPMADDDLARLAAGRYGVERDRDALANARRLALRAHGNPLHLDFLLSVFELNGLSLADAGAAEIGELKDNFYEALLDVWERHLPGDARWAAIVADVVGTPANEYVLGAAAAVLVPGDDPIDFRASVDRAITYGWMLADEDPYGSDRYVRFADPMFATAAEDRAERVMAARRRAACDMAVVAGISDEGFGTRSSTAGQLLAARNALRLLDEGKTGEEVTLVAAPLARHKLGAILYLLGDREGAVPHLREGAEQMAASSGASPPERNVAIADAATAMYATGDHAGAVAIHDLAGDALLAAKARMLKLTSRYDEAVEVGMAALEVELAAPGTLQPSPREDERPLVAALEDALASAMLGGLPYPPQIERLACDVIRARNAAGDLEEARALCRRALESNLLSEESRRELDRELPFDLDDEEYAAEDELARETNPGEILAVAAERLAMGTPDALRAVDSSVNMLALFGDRDGAVRLARQLVEQGGLQYAARLAETEAAVHDHEAAVQHFREGLVVTLAEQALDAPDVQHLQASLALSLARTGQDDEATRRAEQLVVVATDVGNPVGVARALRCLGVVETVGGRPTAGLATLRRARELEDRLPGRPRLRSDLELCEAHARLGEWKEVGSLTEGWSDAQRIGHDAAAALATMWHWVARYELDSDAAVESLLAVAGLDGLTGRPREVAATMAERVFRYLCDTAASLDPDPQFDDSPGEVRRVICELAERHADPADAAGLGCRPV